MAPALSSWHLVSSLRSGLLSSTGTSIPTGGSGAGPPSNWTSPWQRAVARVRRQSGPQVEAFTRFPAGQRRKRGWRAIGCISANVGNWAGSAAGAGRQHGFGHLDGAMVEQRCFGRLRSELSEELSLGRKLAAFHHVQRGTVELGQDVAHRCRLDWCLLRERQGGRNRSGREQNAPGCHDERGPLGYEPE